MTENKNIGLRSREVREILDKPPSWIIRWGILMVTVLLLVAAVVVLLIYK